VSEPLMAIVCDDDDDRAIDWAERINDAAGTAVTARALTSEIFGEAVAALKERKAYAKQNGALPIEPDAANEFDGADVVILDSDLTPDTGSAQRRVPSNVVQQHLVGELGGEVAHLARCYSRAGTLVVVNQRWKRRSFDLTLLAFASEIAEVYVSETDLDSPGLWALPALDPATFRPWSWPALDVLPYELEALCSSVALQDRVLGALGMDGAGVADAFTDRQLDALGVESVQSMTFDNVASESEFGLRLKETVDSDQRLRIAVCGVRRWLERHVLPSHNVLIDAPHLLQRRPWAVPDRDALDAWNQPANWFVNPEAPEPAVNPSPDSYAPIASRWLGRHVWLWPIATQDPRSVDQRVMPADPVFCEDISAFVAATDARDFISDLEGPTGQRFVKTIPDVDYHPRRRLLT
jgi:hypothetical protein